MIGLQFRAWYVENGKHVLADRVSVTSGAVWTAHCDTAYSGFDFDQDHGILEMFTGFHDLHGIKIFEGDILETYVDCGPAGIEQFTVVASMSGLGINLQHWVFDEVGALPTILGNIHRNPELLIP